MDVLVANKFHYLRGGAEKNVFDEKKILAGLGHDILDFSMSHEENRPSEYSRYFAQNMDFTTVSSSIKGFPKGMNPAYNLDARSRIEGLLTDHHVDAAHLHNIYHQLTPSIIAPLKKRDINVVMTLHDYKLVCPNYLLYTGGRTCDRCGGKRYYNCLAHKCIKRSHLMSLYGCLQSYLTGLLGLYRKVDVFTSPSRFLIQKFRELGFRRPITHLPLPILANEYRPDYGPGEYILYAGRVSAEKGLKTLITACESAKMPLRIAGDGPQMTGLKEIVASKSIDVEFLGHLDEPGLHDAVRGSMFTVVPSHWYENQPYAILESFALGKPVIGSDLGGIRELIMAGETGMLFEPGDPVDLADKIRALIRLDLDGMGRTCRDWVIQNHSPDKYGESLSLLLERRWIQKR
ncbi:glycosyltransferase [Candidatus Altiarchaeota archaeon]